MNVLISGLNNYVGRRSVSLMAEEGFGVFAITRNLKLFESRLFEPLRAKVYELDLIRGSVDYDFYIPDLRASFYFTQVPTLQDVVNLKLELLSLRNFIQLLSRMNCRRLVYVARLVDRDEIQPILDLLEEFDMDYTVVLKNSVLGRDALLDRVFRSIAERRFILYSKQYAGRSFQPIGVRDFVRWLKRMLDVPAFHYKVLEVGGGEFISFMELFDLYRSLHLIKSGQRIINVPRWLVKFLYSRKLDISSTDYAELTTVIRSDYRVGNGWQTDMPFEFSSIQTALLADNMSRT
jgi:hypothetical protein